MRKELHGVPPLLYVNVGLPRDIAWKGRLVSFPYYWTSRGRLFVLGRL